MDSITTVSKDLYVVDGRVLLSPEEYRFGIYLSSLERLTGKPMPRGNYTVVFTLDPDGDLIIEVLGNMPKIRHISGGLYLPVCFLPDWDKKRVRREVFVNGKQFLG